MTFVYDARRLQRCFALAFMVTASACGGSEPAGPEPDSQSEEESFTVPAQGTAATFDWATWNIEWFGSTSNGPAAEAGQLNHVRDIIASTDFDLWGVQEISVGSHFTSPVGRGHGVEGVSGRDLGRSRRYGGGRDLDPRLRRRDRSSTRLERSDGLVPGWLSPGIPRRQPRYGV